MKKSIYSVMLFDEIVEQIDQLAYLKKTSRSQMINDMLAVQLGMMTPEQKIERVFNNISESFANRMIIDQKGTTNQLSLGKSLKYKYRPKVYYNYEFVGENRKKFAVLKINSRTTSESLNSHLNHFFNMINEIDLNGEKNELKDQSTYMFVRSFPEGSSISQDSQSISKTLINYLNMIDDAMNYYFNHLEDSSVYEDLQEIYERYYRGK